MSESKGELQKQILTQVQEGEQSSEQPKKKSQRWIVLASLSGVVFAVGNFFFGRSLADKGIWGVAITGPTSLVFLIIYRVYTICKTKRETGYFVDKKNSNWYHAETGRFRTEQLVPLNVMWIPAIIGLLLVSYAFTYATIANMNQGIIPSLFTLASVYVLIACYIKFGEKVSKVVLFGMSLMIFCVLCLCLSGSNTDESDGTNSSIISQNTYPIEYQKKAAYFAIIIGAICPMNWALKAFYYKLNKSTYPAWDLAIDGLIVESIVQTLLVVIYVCSVSSVTSSEFWDGQLAGVLYTLGKLFLAVSYAEGLGGPANSLSCTQIIYQVALNWIFRGYSLTPVQVIGVFLGILSAVTISMGDMTVDFVKAKCRGQSVTSDK